MPFYPSTELSTSQDILCNKMQQQYINWI